MALVSAWFPQAGPRRCGSAPSSLERQRAPYTRTGRDLCPSPKSCAADGRGVITFENLGRRPSAFQSMTGLSVEAFQALLGAFVRAHEERCCASQTTKRGGKPRQRALGAGRRYSHDLRTRLLMALVWLRIYPT